MTKYTKHFHQKTKTKSKIADKINTGVHSLMMSLLINIEYTYMTAHSITGTVTLFPESAL